MKIKKKYSSEADDDYRERILAKIGLEEPPLYIQPKPSSTPRKVELSPLAVRLIQRKDRKAREEHENERRRANANIAAITPHATPLREVKQFWAESYGARDFEAQQRAYNGALRSQESGNLTHDLTALIKHRK